MQSSCGSSSSSAAATGPTLPEEVPFLSIRLEYWAAAALLYAVFSELPEITRQLSKVYSESQLQDMSTRLSSEYDNYTGLRAGCDGSLRQVRLPTVPALMAFISQALLAFGQWCSWLGQRDPRPSTAAPPSPSRGRSSAPPPSGSACRPGLPRERGLGMRVELARGFSLAGQSIHW